MRSSPRGGALRRPVALVPLLGLLTTTGAGCAVALNYLDPGGPRYSGRYGVATADADLRVVTFNIKFSQEIDRAIELFQASDELRKADVVALQEMDSEGVERIARALSMNYVYYPAARHPSLGRDFGNAILSPWPLTDDRKLILPHHSRWRDMQRIAVAATVLAAGQPVRVYSVHLETPASLGQTARQAQAAAVIHDALRHPRAVVAGDFNSKAIGELFEWYGFRWLTKDLGRTISFFAWDHVFARGLSPVTGSAAGIVPDNRGASDHLPVWTVLGLQGPAEMARAWMAAAR